MANTYAGRALYLAGLVCAAAASTGCDDCTEYAIMPTTVEPVPACLYVSAPPGQVARCYGPGTTALNGSTGFDVRNGCSEAFVVEGDFVVEYGSQTDAPARFEPGAIGTLIVENRMIGEVDGVVTQISFPAKLGDESLTIRVDWVEQ